LRGIFKERTIKLKEKIPPLGIHYNYTKFVQQFFYFIFKLTFFCFPFSGERRGFWGKVGGWFTLAGMCKHGNACIILATDRQKEDSRKQFATIYFVGESTSVGTTTTTHSPWQHTSGIRDMRACITFGNGNGSLYATTFVTNNILWVPK
jgi:hypothetical protein